MKGKLIDVIVVGVERRFCSTGNLRLILLNLQHHILEVDEINSFPEQTVSEKVHWEILAPVMLQDEKLASSDEKLTSVNYMLQLPALDDRKHGDALCSVDEAVPIIEALNVDFENGVAGPGVVLLECWARFGLVIGPPAHFVSYGRGRRWRSWVDLQ